MNEIRNEIKILNDEINNYSKFDNLINTIYNEYEHEYENENIPNNIENLIFIENINRFNGITVFPIDNNINQLGIRFDVFNQSYKKFNPTHYIILEYTSIKDDNHHWEIIHHTLPSSIDIIHYQLLYLHNVNPNDNNTPDASSIPQFNLINKFAMRILQCLYSNL